MTIKLNSITTQYRKFNTNQVLTEDQLNEFLDYFEDQDHLSRIGLSGVGIVCGFETTFDSASSSITITQGYGVTTDGDLLTLQNPFMVGEGIKSTILKSIDLKSKTYTHYKTYLNDKVNYKPFFYIDDTQIDLWELHAEEEIETDDTSYSHLEAFSGLEDMVVFLYLENYAKEGELCTALTCDNQGIEQIARIKVLLVSRDNARYMLNLDSIYTHHNWYDTYTALPSVAAKRDIFNPDNTNTYQEIKQEYSTSIKLNGAHNDLKLGLNFLLNKFNKPTISAQIDLLFNFGSSSIPSDIQYRYGLFKDLIATYNEIKELLLQINVECCPDINAFPKHLFLGKLIETENFATLRHRFYKSPIIGHEDENYKKVLLLLDRVSAQVNKYITGVKGSTIKITPSMKYGQLGKKAIPFYYRVDSEFLKNWSFKNSSTGKQLYNISYHTGNLAPEPHVQLPIAYPEEEHNFYRIEGHQGKKYRDALDQIFSKKTEFGLAFDVKALSIKVNTDEINLGDYSCEFEDLTVLLRAWRKEQQCILTEVNTYLKGFNTKKPGENSKDLKYTGVQKVDISVGDSTDGTFLDSIDSNLLSNAPMKVSKAEVDTFGYFVEKAITENEKKCPGDIKSKTREHLALEMASSEWAENNELRTFMMGTGIDLMVDIYDVERKLPEGIGGITAPDLSEYSTSIEELCSNVKKLKTYYLKSPLSEVQKSIIELQINQLATVCCSAEKLKILLEEIEKRKEKILVRLQLSSFVEKHPGLQHLAGVSPGGTFVMVYVQKDAIDETTSEPVSLTIKFLKQPSVITEKILIKREAGEIKLWDDRISPKINFSKSTERFAGKLFGDKVENVPIGKTVSATVGNLADFLNRFWQIAGVDEDCQAIAKKNLLRITIKNREVRPNKYYTRFRETGLTGTNQKLFFPESSTRAGSTTAANTVVADFALPYMCCSDCAPVNFIVPKEPIRLSLPEPSLCFDEDTLPLPFTAAPSDGEVKAFVDEGLIGGVVKNPDNSFSFDPKSVEEALYGTPIFFTLNGEQTNCEIIVNPKVEVEVALSEIVYEDGNRKAMVTFEVSGDPLPANATFRWNLGNSSLSSQKPNTDNQVTLNYDLPVNDENRVRPTLTIGNVPCINEIAIEEISFEDIIIEDNCFETNITNIKRDFEVISAINLDDPVRPIEEKAEEIFSEILSNAQDYLEGKKNDNLNGLLIPIMEQIVNILVTSEGTNAISDQMKVALIEILRALIRLLFNILACQSEEVLDRTKDFISDLLKETRRALKILNDKEISFDKNGELRIFLEEYSSKESTPSFISNYLERFLIPIVK